MMAYVGHFLANINPALVKRLVFAGHIEFSLWQAKLNIIKAIYSQELRDNTWLGTTNDYP